MTTSKTTTSRTIRTAATLALALGLMATGPGGADARGFGGGGFGGGGFGGGLGVSRGGLGSVGGQGFSGGAVRGIAVGERYPGGFGGRDPSEGRVVPTRGRGGILDGRFPGGVDDGGDRARPMPVFSRVGEVGRQVPDLGCWRWSYVRHEAVYWCHHY